MSNESSKWHWAEGMRYAHEGIKLLFVLNGASAVAILTFIGNAKIYSNAFILSMIFFALGSVAGIISMILAYLTQLEYGNAEIHDTNREAHSATWNTAQKYHHWVYVSVALGIIFFMLGVGCAAYGIYIKPACFVV